MRSLKVLEPADYDSATLGALPLVPVPASVLGPGPGPAGVLTADASASSDFLDLVVIWEPAAAAACRRCTACTARLVGPVAVCSVVAEAGPG